MWQRSGNLETLGGRERSLRGLCVSERESERDHRPVAAQWQEPPRRDEDTCDFSSLLVKGHGLHVFTPAVQRTQRNTDLRFITARLHLRAWHMWVRNCGTCIETHISAWFNEMYDECAAGCSSFTPTFVDFSYFPGSNIFWHCALKTVSANLTLLLNGTM